MSEHFPDWSEEANKPSVPPLTVEDYLGEQTQPWLYANQPNYLDNPDAQEPVSQAEEELIVAFAASAEEELRLATEKVRASTSEALQAATQRLLGMVVDTVLEEMDAIDAEYDKIIDDHPFAIPQTKTTEKKGPGLF